MTERRELPIEDADNARLGRMEDHVVEAKIAVTDRGLVAGGNVLRQPFDEPVDRRVLARLGVLPLPRPAIDLA
jgi:hypothetical protein